MAGVVGELLEGGIRLQVKGPNGGDIEGITVHFQVLSGGGIVEPTEVITDAGGWAEVQWTLGAVAGDQDLDLVAQFAAPAGASAAEGATPVGALPAPGEGVTRSVKVRAKAAAPKTVNIIPASAQLLTDGQLAFQAGVEDKFGNEVTNEELVWSTSDPSTITVSDVGMVNAVSLGSAEVVATVVGKPLSGSAHVEVVTTLDEVTITTTSMPAGMVGMAYSQTLIATGGNGAYAWALFNGTAVPAGLALNAVTGEISGTPTAVGTTNFEVQVTTAGQTTTSALQITIDPAEATPPSIVTNSPMPDGTVGVAYSQMLAATGGDGAYAWALFNGTTLPTGLSLNAGTGVISGTPTTAGVTNFEVEVTSAGNTDTKALFIDVNTNSPGQVGQVTDLAVLATTANSVTLAFTEVDDGTGSPPSYDIRYATPPMSWGGATFAQGTCAGPLSGVAVGASLVSQVEGLDVGTSYDFQLVTFRGTLNVDAVFGSLSNVVTASTAISNELMITTTSLPVGTVGMAYSQTLAVTNGNGNYTWAMFNGTTLPAGLGLNVATGQISGTPTAAGTTNFEVEVTSGGNTDTQTLSIVINDPAPPNVTTTSMSAGTVGASYSRTLAATGGDGNYTWAMFNGTTPPAGLGLNAATGEISGTPTVAGTTNFEVEVASAGQTATKALALTVNAPGAGPWFEEDWTQFENNGDINALPYMTTFGATQGRVNVETALTGTPWGGD